MSIEVQTVYFDNPGKENTDEVLRIAKNRAEETGIKTIIVASTRGETGEKAMEVLTGLRVIIVGHATGMREPNVQFFSEDIRKRIESKGGIVLNATHVLAGINAAMRAKHSVPGIEDIIADTYRTLGHGVKVAVEIAMMAADHGLVRTDEDVITIGGRSSGADTALVLKPVNSVRFFDLQIREILCKPHF